MVAGAVLKEIMTCCLARSSGTCLEGSSFLHRSMTGRGRRKRKRILLLPARLSSLMADLFLNGRSGLLEIDGLKVLARTTRLGRSPAQHCLLQLWRPAAFSGRMSKLISMEDMSQNRLDVIAVPRGLDPELAGAALEPTPYPSSYVTPRLSSCSARRG